MRLAARSPRTTTARLWRGGGLLATLLLTLLIGNALLDSSRGLGTADLGHDFLAMYTAGAMVRDGRSEDLYDLKKVQAAEAETVDKFALRAGSQPGRLASVAPWWYPPFFALTFVPLAALPYPAALGVWTAFNLACLVGAMALLARMLGPAAGWRRRGLVPLLVLTSRPFVLALSHGQNTFLSLLLLCGVVTCWRSGRALAAGVIGGLLCYKPQLAAAVAAGLFLTLGGRALLGLLIGGGSLLVANVLLLPGTLGDWLGRLPANLATVRFEHVYQWDRHVTLLAFFRTLLQGRAAGETAWEVNALTAIVGLALAAALLLAALRAWRVKPSNETLPRLAAPLAGCFSAIPHPASGAAKRPVGSTSNAPARANVALDRFIAAVILSMPLLMPFYFDYDLLLLSVPAALLARERLDDQPVKPRAQRVLLSSGGEKRSLRSRLTVPVEALWVALFLWLPFNAPVDRMTGLNGGVLLLAALAAVALRRAIQRSDVVAVELESRAPVRVRLAA